MRLLCATISCLFRALLLYCVFVCARHMGFCVALLFFASENEMKNRKRVITALRKIYMQRLNEYQCSHNSFGPIVNRRSCTNGLEADGTVLHTHKRPCAHHPSYLFRLGIYLFFYFISHKNLNCISFQAKASRTQR